jgi:hypothetical protein
MFLFAASAKVVSVNTTNNVSPGLGETNLVQAIEALEDGDTIAFNIPGTGPHYLITPEMVTGDGGGYPEITKNNVTIDGYTQPGSSPNTNTILAANNAKLQIVLDSRAGGRHVWNIPGYGDTESGILVVSGYNVTIRGLSFLSVPGADATEDPKIYGIALGKGSDGAHISGCWFGVDPDGRGLAGFNDGITGFTFNGDRQTNVVVGVAPGSTNPRAEFNVFAALEIPVIIEGNTIRISGNFFGLLPDGVSRVPNPEYVDGWEGYIEIGREGWDSIIGVDGDGVNDTEERNVMAGGFDGSTGVITESTYDSVIEFYSNNDRTNIVIAGNYVGMAVDGSFLTNATRLLNGLNSAGSVRIGSDFDGVSDSLEGNVLAGNFPFESTFPVPIGSVPPEFIGYDVGERVSLRGNTLINTSIAPFSYATGSQDQLEKLTNLYAPFIITNQIIPKLDTNSTASRILGTADVGLDPYTNLVIDVYVADPTAWTNGQKFQLAELMYQDDQGQTHFYGFPVGRTYLGSFVDNGPQDSNSAAGAFDFNASSLNIPANTFATITANYSADPLGTHNGRTQTSLFSNPVTLTGTGSVGGVTLSAARSGNSLLLSWPAAQGTYKVQSRSAVTIGDWADLTPQPPITQVGDTMQATVPIAGDSMFLRLAQ